MAKASAPPGVPTPICRIEVVKTTISPLLSARSHTSARIPSFEWPNFLRVNVLLVIRDAIVWDVSRDFLRFRQRKHHSSSSNCFEVGSFSFFQNINRVLSRKWHSSGKSPVAQLIVRMSSSRNRRLLWPAPAKETVASRCSCRSPVGPGAHIGDSLT